MEKTWWKSAVGYQIYPKSFYDTNQDGIGDLPGIIAKLDYLKDLGVNLLWIGPFYKSPMDDNGYDVSDFFQVDPSFGTLEDAKVLIKQAHKRHIKIILDLVLNHTSDEHPWFIESRSSLDNPKREYYIWQDGKLDQNGKLIPPTNWASFFDGSAWNHDPITNQYYMKIFSDKMPDLNWDNPALRQEMYHMTRWWLDLGIDGFRVDAIAHLARDLSFTDSTLPLNRNNNAPDWSKFSNRPEQFNYLHEFYDQVLSKYECMTIGEVGGGAKIEAGLQYAAYDSHIFNMVFNFDSCWQNNIFGNENLKEEDYKIDVIGLKRNLTYWIDGMKDKGWLPQYWLNHDHPRVMSQYGNPMHYHRESGTMLATILLTLPGTPFIYNGEEIGMTNVDYQSIDDFNDVWVKTFYNNAKHEMSDEQILAYLTRISRNNARTPMQWDDSNYAGFSSVQPHQKNVGNYKEINVEKQSNQADSILNTYRYLIHLRRKSKYKDILVYGDYLLIEPEHPQLFVYHRKLINKHLMIVTNFSQEPCEYILPVKKFKVLYNNYNNQASTSKLSLLPYEAMIIEVQNA